MNKQILRLAVPFIISNLTVPLVSTADTALMGNFGSTAHLGAIGLGGAIFNFLYWNFSFIRMSAAGLTAQAFGSENTQEMGQLLGRAMLVSMAGAFGLLILQWPIREVAFLLSGGDPEVIRYARDYFNIRIYAAPATIGLSAITGWFIGMQNARAPMIISIIVNILNIGFSFFFVTVLGLKSEGVAWGTLIAQYSGFVIALFILARKYYNIFTQLHWNELFIKSKYLRFFNMNKDVFIRTFFVILVLTFYNFVSARQGKTILGMNVVFLQLIYAFSFFIDGFANAAEALVGKFVGAKRIYELLKVIRLLFIWGISIALVFTITYLIGWRIIMRIYTSDPNIIEAAREFIFWIMAIPLISITAFIWDGIYLGVTATKEYRNATLIAASVFFILFATLSWKFGNHALLLAQLVFFGLRGLIQTRKYKTAILDKLR